MREMVLSATVLLCAVFLIRGVLKDRIPAGARYALWALVALRLLVPVNLGAVSYTHLTLPTTERV